MHYSAVSYCWGDKPEYSHELACRDPRHPLTALKITPNVDSLLRHLRKPHKSRHLWIDAICLNQEDQDEMSTPAMLMGVIYSQAKKVHIWLGAETDGRLAADAFGLLRRIVLGDDACRVSPDELAILRPLFGRSWFGRRWVIQEVALARHATVHCGPLSIELSWIVAAL